MSALLLSNDGDVVRAAPATATAEARLSIILAWAEKGDVVIREAGTSGRDALHPASER